MEREDEREKKIGRGLEDEVQKVMLRMEDKDGMVRMK